MQVLAADLAAVHDCIFANESLLDKLFAFLERDAPLNTLLAGYFGKVVSTLLSRRPDDTLKVIENRNLVPQLLRHLGAYSILELLLKVSHDLTWVGRYVKRVPSVKYPVSMGLSIAACWYLESGKLLRFQYSWCRLVVQLVSEAEEKDSDGGSQMEWLYSQDLVGKLIAKLDTAEESGVHANAAAALVHFISQQQQMHWSASLPSTQSRFTASLIATHSVSALLERLLAGSASALEHGLTVLVELVRHSTSASRGGQGALSAVVVEVLKRMGDFVTVLRSPPPTAPIVNSTGTLNPPLGQNRLKILEVVLALVSLKHPEVEAKMIGTTCSVFVA